MTPYKVIEKQMNNKFVPQGEIVLFETDSLKEAKHFAENYIIEENRKASIFISKTNDAKTRTDIWTIQSNIYSVKKDEIDRLIESSEELNLDLRKKMLTYMKGEVNNLLWDTGSNTLSFEQWGYETGNEGNNIMVYFKHGIHAEGPACKLRLQEKKDKTGEDLFVEISLEYENAEIPVNTLDTDDMYSLIVILSNLWQDTMDDAEWTINNNGEVVKNQEE